MKKNRSSALGLIAAFSLLMVARALFTCFFFGLCMVSVHRHKTPGRMAKRTISGARFFHSFFFGVGAPVLAQN